MEAPAPLIALKSEANKDTAKMRAKWLNEPIGKPFQKSISHRKDAKDAKETLKRHKNHKYKLTKPVRP